MNEREISLVSEWNSFVSNENYNLIEKCLKLAQILEYPELDTSNEIEKIRELGINFRNRIIKVIITQEGADFDIDAGEPLEILVNEKPITLSA